MDMAERIERLDKKRRMLHILELSSQIIILSFYVIHFLVAFIDPMIMRLTPILTIGFVIFLVIFYGRTREDIKKKYQKELKTELIGPLLETKFENMSYVWDGFFTPQMVSEFQLCTMGNIFRTEDYIRGTYRGVDFEQSDVLVQQHSGKHTYTHFKGRMLVFRYPGIKMVNSIKIYTKNYSYPSKLGTNTKIDMENEEFNKLFKVLAYDSHEAFYFLTPQVMERILELRRTYGNFCVHIKNGVVYVGLNNVEDTLDPSISEKLDYMEIRRKVNRDTDAIKDIIEILKLAELEAEAPVEQPIKNDYYSEPAENPYYSYNDTQSYDDSNPYYQNN